MKRKTQKNIIKILAELKRGLRQLYSDRLISVILYGSYARGEALKDSDIDLVVVLKGGVRPGREIDYMLDVVTDLNLKYNTLISICPVSENAFKTVKSPRILNVRQEGIFL